MATTTSTSLSVKVSRGTQLRERYLTNHIRAHSVTSKFEDPISQDAAIFDCRAQLVLKAKNAYTQAGKNGPYGKRTKPNSLKILEPSDQCIAFLKRGAEDDPSPHRVLPKLRKIEEIHDMSYEEYADNFFQELERSANDSEYFIRIED